MSDHAARQHPPQNAGAFRRARRPAERIELLGGAMDLVKPAEVFHFVNGKLDAGERAIIANHNLHSLYLLRKDPELRAFYDLADLVEVDSIPLILWARLLGHPSRRFHRCTYLDWRDDFWAMAASQGRRVFFLGGAPGVAETAAAKIRAAWPSVHLETHHGYFDIATESQENQAVMAAIRAFAPDILIVGMGMPRQEAWVARNHAALPVCAVFTVGGAFDYEAGVQRPCPRWIGQLGAEWLFRLCTNRRLFSRYVIEPWGLVGLAVSDLGRFWRRKPVRNARQAH